MAIGEKQPISLSWDTIIRYGIYIIIAACGYTSISAKSDYNTEMLKEIKEAQKKTDDKWDITKDALKAELAVVQLQLNTIKQRLDDKEKDEAKNGE